MRPSQLRAKMLSGWLVDGPRPLSATSRNGPTQRVSVDDGKNAEPLEHSTRPIGPWEGKEQQEAQGVHYTTGLGVFATCQDMNESTIELDMYTFRHAICFL
jgi:hypothetical protein